MRILFKLPIDKILKVWYNIKFGSSGPPMSRLLFDSKPSFFQNPFRFFNFIFHSVAFDTQIGFTIVFVNKEVESIARLNI